MNINQICWPCTSDSFLLKVEKEDPVKKFWKNAKEFSLWAVLYVPIAFFICQKFGLASELWWIGGGIFIQLLPPFHQWLLRKI